MCRWITDTFYNLYLGLQSVSEENSKSMDTQASAFENDFFSNKENCQKGEGFSKSIEQQTANVTSLAQNICEATGNIEEIYKYVDNLSSKVSPFTELNQNQLLERQNDSQRLPVLPYKCIQCQKCESGNIYLCDLEGVEQPFCEKCYKNITNPNAEVHEEDVQMHSTDKATATSLLGEGKYKRPKRPCPFCKSDGFSNLTRHLKNVHYDRTDIKQVLKLPRLARCHAFSLLRKQGILKENTEMLRNKTSTILLQERKNKNNSGVKVCQKCKGFFSARTVHRHIKYCKFSPSLPITIAQAFPASFVENEDDAPRLHKNVLQMRNDEIGIFIKNDILTQRIGERYYNSKYSDTYKSKTLIFFTKQEMRTLVSVFLPFRVILAKKLDVLPEEISLEEMFCRDSKRFPTKNKNHFKILKQTIKEYSSSNEKEKTRIFWTLKRTSESLAEIFKAKGKADTATEIRYWQSAFTTLTSSIFSSIKSSHCGKKTKLRKPEPPPVSFDDLDVTRDYLLAQIEKVNQKCADPFSIDFVLLRRCVLTRLTFLNGPKSEASLLTFKDISEAKKDTWINREYAKKMEGQEERNLLEKIRLTYVSGKLKSKGKRLPILIPSECMSAIDLLCDNTVRYIAQIHPSNEYVFAAKGRKKYNVYEYSDVKALITKLDISKNISITRMQHFISTEAANYGRSLENKEKLRQFAMRFGHGKKSNINAYACPLPIQEVALVTAVIDLFDKRDPEDALDEELIEDTGAEVYEEPGTEMDEEPGTEMDEEPGTEMDEEPDTEMDEEPGTEMDGKPGTAGSSGVKKRPYLERSSKNLTPKRLKSRDYRGESSASSSDRTPVCQPAPSSLGPMPNRIVTPSSVPTRSSSRLKKEAPAKKHPPELAMEVISGFDEGVSPQTIICREIEVPKSTAAATGKKPGKYREAENVTSQTLKPKIRLSRDSRLNKIENMLVSWIEDRTQHQMPVNMGIIQDQALSLWQDLHTSAPTSPTSNTQETFNASREWFQSFRQRVHLPNISMAGEAARSEADKYTDVASVFPEAFRKLVQEGGFTSKQIFNIDETALFWKNLPERTLILNGENTTELKVSKDRLTLALGGNAAGDVKLKPLLVYHSPHPAAFNNVNMNTLPVMWTSDAKVSVTSKIFHDYVTGYLTSFVTSYTAKENLSNKILLVLDSAPGHPPSMVDWCHNVRVCFLPPHATSLLQPMGQVISTFQRYFSRRILKDLNRAKDRGLGPTKSYWKAFDIKMAVEHVVAAWAEITSGTMNAVWRNLWPQAVSDEVRMPDQASLNRELVGLANTAFLGESEALSEDDIEAFIASHQETLSDDQLLELQQQQQQREERDSPSPLGLPSLSIDGLCGILDAADKLKDAVLDTDPDVRRSFHVRTKIQEAMEAYADLLREKKENARHSLIDFAPPPFAFQPPGNRQRHQTSPSHT